MALLSPTFRLGNVLDSTPRSGAILSSVDGSFYLSPGGSTSDGPGMGLYPVSGSPVYDTSDPFGTQTLYDTPITGGSADPVQAILDAADANAAAATNSPITSAETVNVTASWPPPWLIIAVVLVGLYFLYWKGK